MFNTKTYTQDFIQNSGNLPTLLASNNIKQEGNFQEINVFELLDGKLLELAWLLWEILATGSSLLVVADNATVCSEVVLASLSLISPLKFQGDFRPYFTIYDPDYAAIQNNSNSFVLGITNPLFLKAFSDFKFVLRLDSEYKNNELPKKKNSKLCKRLFSKSEKFCISVSEDLLTQVLKGNSRETMAINNSLLRKHFRGLTNSLLQVFEEFIAEQTNDIKTFNEKDFLRWANSKKLPLDAFFKSKARTMNLLEKFIKSSNFTSFISSKGNVYFAKKTPVLI